MLFFYRFLFFTFFSPLCTVGLFANDLPIVEESSYENYVVSPFNELVLSGSFNVFLTQGKELSLRLEGDPIYLEQIEVQQDDDRLLIVLQVNPGQRFIYRKVSVFLTTPSISEIYTNGNVHLMGENELAVQNLKITSYGLGKTVFALNVANLEVDIQGAGDMLFSGFAAHQNVFIHGAGNYKAEELMNDSANVEIYGIGKVYLKVNSELNAKIYGCGDLYFKGEPSIHSQLYGSGKIKGLGLN